jgi:hypothetical protein
MSRRIIVVMFLAFVFVAAISADTEKHDAIGYIEAFHGTVYFKADAAAPERRLSQKSDIAQKLWTGNRLRCESGGWVRVLIGGEVEQIRSTSWRVLSSFPDRVPTQVRAALDEYGRTGGRPRSDDTLHGPVLQWPSEDDIVLPATFVIRWSTAGKTCPLTLTLQTMDRDLIWSGPVDANREIVDAVDLRQRLSTHRGSRMNLAMSGPCTGDQNAIFEVMSNEEEAQLNEELRFWASYAGQAIFSRLGRASVFAAHRLHIEAASEYDAALREAPESHDLLTRTIAAHARVGDFRRVKELQDRLRE